MTKKSYISEEDKALFRAAVRQIKPHRHTKQEFRNNPSTKTFKPKDIEPEEVDRFSDYETLPPVEGNSLLHYTRPGIQHKILRNLRKGKYNVEATLDLHGKTVEEARRALSVFLNKCQANGIRHILIIHGKGKHNHKPILKNKLNHWLRQTDQVLAFSSATIRDGFSGALYVLLKS